MKRVGNIYDQICSFENVRKAAIEAMRNKSLTRQMKSFASNFERNCHDLAMNLQTFNFPACTYSIKIVSEPKVRQILIAPFYWRVVHQAIAIVLKETWNGSLINNTYACIPERGIHKALRDVQKAMNAEKAPLYALKIDVKKYFDNVDHQVLKSIIERKIKDQKALKLINFIIDSMKGGKGIPIGNLTSQYFANLYLSPLDYYAKHTLKVKHYFRYMDDVVILHTDKKMLHELLQLIRMFLENELKLTLKSNYQIFPVAARQLDFVGYRMNQHTTMLRKRILMNFYSKARALRKNGNEINIKTQLSSHFGWINHLPVSNSKKIFSYATKTL
jgi:RNA-directed DNA polymerase